MSAVLPNRSRSPHHHRNWWIAGVALLASLALDLTLPQAAAAGWLVAVTYCGAVPVGALVWLMIHRLTGGAWGETLRPAFAAATLSLPVLAVLSLPILLAPPSLYAWARSTEGLQPDVVNLYLNHYGFAARGGAALLIWSLLGRYFARAGTQRGVFSAAAGIAVHGLLISLVAWDWLLSIDPHQVSSAFPASVAVAQLLAALAWVALVAPLAAPKIAADLSGLLLACLLGLVYLDYMQWLVAWYSDQPADAPWYLRHGAGAWVALPAGAFTIGGVLPFALLLDGGRRRSPTSLRIVGAAVLCGLWLRQLWLVAPAVGAAALATASLAMIAVASFFIAVAPRLQGRSTT